MAAGKYELVDGEKLRLTKAVIAYDTVIEAGDIVTLTSGLVTKAAAASDTIAWCPDGHASGETTDTTCEITVGNDFTLKTTGDAVFAAAYRGEIFDINDTTQYIDYGASSTDVLVVDPSINAGTVGTAAGVTVRINKPIF
jgi:hypothetical protein